jgi:capsid protein
MRDTFGRRAQSPEVVRMELNRIDKELILQERRERAVNAFYTRYSGGSYGRRTDGAKMPGGLSNSGMARVFDHAKLRRNVRDAMYDSVEAHAIAHRMSDIVVDVGLKIKLEPNIELLGISESVAGEWSRINSSRFNMWLQSKDFTTDGNNNGYQSQWLYALSQQRDNDMYTRIHYSDDPDLMSPIQIQSIDPDQVMMYGFTPTYGLQPSKKHTRETKAGIVYDEAGAEKEYNIIVDTKEGYKQITIPRKTDEGRILMLHGFRAEYAGQRQGYPLYTHLLQELENITDLKASHLQKAINQSTFGFYTKPSKDSHASGGIADIANADAGVVEDFLGADEIDGMSSEEQMAFALNILPEVSIRQPGSVWNTTLGPGEDMRAVEQTAPADKFAEFADNLISYMSASAGMPIEVLLMKFGENYSASRATLVLLWRICNMWRAEMASDYLNPIFQMWLAEEIAAGRTTAPGWQDPRLRAAWCKCRWIGTPIPTINPKDEAAAAKERANLGHETLADGALSYNGSDAAANRAKLRKEIPGLAIGPWSTNYRYSDKVLSITEGDNGGNG